MSVLVSHKPFEVIAYPARALTPDILYLQVGDDIPAAAGRFDAGWVITVVGGDGDTVTVRDEAAARDWLETYAWETAQ